MKKLVMIMMAMLLSVVSYSKGEDELKLSGFYVSTSNVKFEVAIVNDDASRVVVETKSSVFSYRIKLKIGNEYVITFKKGNKEKVLYVTADGPGLMEVDVDFTTDSAAQLCYSEPEDEYNLVLLYKNE
jgi:hypothetical protein